jgi:signal transduction histidine kinase
LGFFPCALLILFSLFPQRVIGKYSPHLDTLSVETILDSIQKIKFKDKETAFKRLHSLYNKVHLEANEEDLYKVLMSLGTQYAYSADYFNALLYYNNALQICEAKDQSPLWRSRQLKTKINLAGIHWALNNNDKLEKANWENLRLAHEIKDTQSIAAIYQGIALYHNQTSQLDSAEYYFNKALNFYLKIGDQLKLNPVYLAYSKNLISQEKYLQAKDLLEKNTAFLNVHHPADYAHFHSTELVKVYYHLGEIDKAYQLACAAKNQVRYQFPSKMDILEIISEIHAANEKFDSAYIYLKEAKNIANAHSKNDLVRKAKELESQLLFQKNAQEKEYLLKINKQTKKMNLIWIIVSLVLFALIHLIIILYKSLLNKSQELDASAKKSDSLNKKLLHLIEDKKNLIGLIAHDIRAPLSHIQLNYHLLLKKVHNPKKEIQQYTQDISNASQLINEALVKLIDIENKSIESEYFNYQTIDAMAIAEVVVKEQSAMAKLKGIKVMLEELNGLNLITVDPFFFKHILTNIVQNALKYSPTQEVVSLQISKTNNIVKVAISDKGPGMVPADLENIYTKASSQFNSPSSNINSWGRGLFLSKKIAEEMKGYIQLGQRNTSGTTFEVCFPAEQKD